MKNSLLDMLSSNKLLVKLFTEYDEEDDEYEEPEDKDYACCELSPGDRKLYDDCVVYPPVVFKFCSKCEPIKGYIVTDEKCKYVLSVHRFKTPIAIKDEQGGSLTLNIKLKN